METKNIDDLKPDPNNPRTMSKHDAEALSKSVTKFGDLAPIVFNIRTQQLVGGHQRMEILKRIPAERRVVIDQRYDQPDDVGTIALGRIYIGNKAFAYREVDWDAMTQKAANIAANRIQGEFNLDLLAEANYILSQNDADLLALTGQTQNEIDRLLDSVGVNGNTTEDEVPEVDRVNLPVSKLGEIYQLGNHRLMCGDSTDFGQLSDLMNGQSADLVFTDPPYGVSYQSNRRTESAEFDVIKNDDKLITEWIEPVLAVSQGFVFIWTSWRVLNEWLEITKSIGNMTNMIIWDKGGGGLGDLQGTYATDFEVALVFNRGAKITGDRLGSVWGIGKDSPSLYEHPTQKPTGLAEQAMKTVTLRGQLVLDVFGGSGSTMIAAERMGRISYTMELDPKYCDVIRKRYAKYVEHDDWITATPVTNAEAPSDQPTAAPVPIPEA
jgi:DNA modification methylase